MYDNVGGTFEEIERFMVTGPNLWMSVETANYAVRRPTANGSVWTPISDSDLAGAIRSVGPENVRVIVDAPPARKVWAEKDRDQHGGFCWVVRVNGAWADQWAEKAPAEMQVNILVRNPETTPFEARQILMQPHEGESDG